MFSCLPSRAIQLESVGDQTTLVKPTRWFRTQQPLAVGQLGDRERTRLEAKNILEQGVPHGGKCTLVRVKPSTPKGIGNQVHWRDYI